MREELPSWCDVRAVDRAAAACARRKRSRPDAIAFRMRYGEEVLSLAARLQSGRYRPEPGWVFVTEQPKPREIHAAPFRDRVVHHLLHELLEPRFERRFIADSFACRRGKGTHAAALRLQDHLWRASRHGQVRAWGLQMDIRSFFCSIHRPTLLALLSKGFSAEELLAPPPSIWRLLEAVVQHDPSRTAARRGPAESFARVPPAKRLGSRGPEYGLPIGNLTSQFFANVYLDALDQFVKRTLGAKHYVRYVDDFVLIHRDPAVLWAWEKEIRSFLSRRLRLELHPVAALLEAARGIDFVGYIARPRYLLPRRRVVKAMERKLDGAERALAHRAVELGSRKLLPGVGQVAGPCSVQKIELRAVEALRAVWGSYQGHLVHANAWRLLRRLWELHPVSRSLLALKGGRVVRRLALPRPALSLREQCERLSRGLAPAVLFVKVGRNAECRWRSAALRLGLRWARRNGRRCAAIPWLEINEVLRRGLMQGMMLGIAVEMPWFEGGLVARRLAYVVRPYPHSKKRVISTGGRRA